MIDQNQAALEAQQMAGSSVIASFMTKVYGWMCLALAVTGLSAWAVASSEATQTFIFGNQVVFWGLLIAELALVWIIAGAINKLSTAMTSLLFLVYSIINGLTLSVIFMLYTTESIATTFFVCAATFGVTSLVGFTIKRDLSAMGRILFMALIGLIIATVVNIFWANSTLYWITTYAGVLIFVGLTAYDTQKLKNMALELGDGNEAVSKWAIRGALSLYLDFINLFLYLLRLFGKRR